MMKRQGILFSLALLFTLRTAIADPMKEIKKLQDEIFKMKIQQEKLQQEINNYQLKEQLSSTLSSMSLNKLMNEVSKIQQEISLLQEKIELEKTKLREAKELGQALMINMPYKGTVMGKYVITDNGIIEAGSNFGLGTVRIKHGGIVKAGPYYLTNENTVGIGTFNTPTSPMGGPVGGMPMSPMGGSPMPPSSPSGGPPSLPPLPPLSSLVGNGSTPPPPPSGTIQPPTAPPGAPPSPTTPPPTQTPPPSAPPPGAIPPSSPMPPHP